MLQCVWGLEDDVTSVFGGNNIVQSYFLARYVSVSHEEKFASVRVVVGYTDREKRKMVRETNGEPLLCSLSW